jgi:DNA replication licensing factor MCM3
MRSNGIGDDEDDDDGDGLYDASPRGQRTLASSTTSRLTRSQAGGPTQSESQISVASSQPASLLVRSQTDDHTQSQSPMDIIASASAASASLPPLAPARLTTFRQALGPLMRSTLFAGDSADVQQVVDAVNTAIRSSSSAREGGGVFDLAEGLQALRIMNDRNEIM